MAQLPMLGSMRRLTADQLKPLISRIPHELTQADVPPIRTILERRNLEQPLTKAERELVGKLTNYVLRQNMQGTAYGARMETPFDDLFAAWDDKALKPSPNPMRNITPIDLLE